MTFSGLHIIIFCLIIVYITGCDFDNPYIPDTVGSSSLTGRIVTDPFMDLNGTQVLIRGQDAYATLADANGVFLFQDIPPGDYILYMQKSPYLQESKTIFIRKATSEDLGDIKVSLKGAISGIVPKDKISIVHGEVDITVYIDGIPIAEPKDEDINIKLSSEKSNISIQAEAKITIYIDNAIYSAAVKDKGAFIIGFVPPGIYNDIRIKLNSFDKAFPIVSGEPVVVKSGQTLSLASGL